MIFYLAKTIIFNSLKDLEYLETKEEFKAYKEKMRKQFKEWGSFIKFSIEEKELLLDEYSILKFLNSTIYEGSNKDKPISNTTKLYYIIQRTRDDPRLYVNTVSAEFIKKLHKNILKFSTYQKAYQYIKNIDSSTPRFIYSNFYQKDSNMDKWNEALYLIEDKY